MDNSIYEFLRSLGQDGILNWVGIFLVGVFIAGFLFEKVRQIAPTLMTSAGILGTFCGVFLALKSVDFTDRETMDQSVRGLLDGMSTAFVTSLLGIGFAIVFRVASIPLSFSLWGFMRRIIQFAPPPPSPEQREVLERLDAIKHAIAGDGDSSMVTQMQKMRDENRDGFKKWDAALPALDAIRQAIAGDGDSSVVTQMQKLRDENREGFKQLEGLAEIIRDALAKNLETLASEIRDIIGRQLGDSLRQLIASIETALIEQFGKTFVEFNEATQALKKWQEDHRAQVEQLTAAFNLAAERIAVIAAECEKIPPTMERLREVVEVAHGNVQSLNKQVEAFAGMRQQAEESFPVIKAHLDKIGSDLEASAKGFDGLEETIKAAFLKVEQESKRAAEQHAKSMGEMSASMRDSLSAVESETWKVAEQHSQNVRQIVADMTATLSKVQHESAQQVTAVVEKAINQFSGEMDREITRVAREWGSNLVAVAERARDAIQAVDDKRQ